MIIGKRYYKRDAVLHCRLPEELKKAFQALAKAQGKTASEYVLELILEELSRQESHGQDHDEENRQNTADHDK
jgi:predicted DNA-binding protein